MFSDDFIVEGSSKKPVKRKAYAIYDRVTAVSSKIHFKTLEIKILF